MSPQTYQIIDYLANLHATGRLDYRSRGQKKIYATLNEESFRRELSYAHEKIWTSLSVECAILRKEFTHEEDVSHSINKLGLLYYLAEEAVIASGVHDRSILTKSWGFSTTDTLDSPSISEGFAAEDNVSSTLTTAMDPADEPLETDYALHPPHTDELSDEVSLFDESTETDVPDLVLNEFKSRVTLLVTCLLMDLFYNEFNKRLSALPEEERSDATIGILVGMLKRKLSAEELQNEYRRFKKNPVMRRSSQELHKTPRRRPSDPRTATQHTDEERFSTSKDNIYVLKEMLELKEEKIRQCFYFFHVQYKNQYNGFKYTYDKVSSLRELLLWGAQSAVARVPQAASESVWYSCIKQVLRECGIEMNKISYCLDPSAGWGNRLLVLSVLPGVKHITCIDPNERLEVAYEKIIADMKSVDEELDHVINYEIIIDAAEEYLQNNTTQLRGKFDLVITSPPYGPCTELYNGTKSSSRYKTIDTWVRDFLNPYLSGVASSIKYNGVFILNVADIKGLSLVKECVQFLIRNTDMEYIPVLSAVPEDYYNSGAKPAPITQQMKAHSFHAKMKCKGVLTECYLAFQKRVRLPQQMGDSSSRSVHGLFSDSQVSSSLSKRKDRNELEDEFSDEFEGPNTQSKRLH